MCMRVCLTVLAVAAACPWTVSGRPAGALCRIAGTALGDPIEVGAAAAVLKDGRRGERFQFSPVAFLVFVLLGSCVSWAVQLPGVPARQAQQQALTR